MDDPNLIHDGSLRSRLAARRTELRDAKPFDIDVPGYGGALRARYRALDYESIRKIGLRQQHNPNQAEREVHIAVDTLVEACICLVAVNENGIEETRFKWNEETARELFGVEESELPDGSPARHALMRIIPNTAMIMSHYVQYDQRARGVEEETSEELAGE